MRVKDRMTSVSLTQVRPVSHKVELRRGTEVRVIEKMWMGYLFLLAQRPITLVLMMINSCSYGTNDLVFI